jgi:hypothetical protein
MRTLSLFVLLSVCGNAFNALQTIDISWQRIVDIG